MNMRKRCAWVVEADGRPMEAWLDKSFAERALAAYSLMRGKARLVRYAPASPTERNRTRQHARAAARRSES
jgi:hypothetical protein